MNPKKCESYVPRKFGAICYALRNFGAIYYAPINFGALCYASRNARAGISAILNARQVNMSIAKAATVLLAATLLGVSSLPGALGRSYSFTYLLSARHVECFHERLVNGSRLEVDYQVSEREQLLKVLSV